MADRAEGTVLSVLYWFKILINLVHQNDVKRNNYTFFSQLPEDKRTEDPNSPLSSPYLPPMENDEPMANGEELAGLQVENVQPTVERMDLD